MYSHTGVCIDTEGYITAFPPYLRLLHWRREVFSSPISSAWRDGMAMTLIDRKHPPHSPSVAPCDITSSKDLARQVVPAGEAHAWCL